MREHVKGFGSELETGTSPAMAKSVMNNKVASLMIVFFAAIEVGSTQTPTYKLGRPATPEEIRKAGYRHHSERDCLPVTNLSKIRMPNRDGFVPDSRPDIDAHKEQEMNSEQAGPSA